MDLTEQDRAERADHHFSRSDYWDFMSHNAVAQIAALTWFRDESPSYPGAPGASTPTEWRERLDEMIDGWQAVLDRDGWDPAASDDEITAFFDVCLARFQAGIAVYTRWYFHLWS